MKKLMLFGIFALTCFTAETFWSVNVSNAQTEVAIPGTPAGHTLQAWLDAFNSGDRAKMQAYLNAEGKSFTINDGGRLMTIDDMVGFRGNTGGFNLLLIEHSEKMRIRFIIGEKKNSSAIARGNLLVKNGQPPTVETFDLRPLSPGSVPKLDHSPHKVQLVAVDKGVKLEVLDWGGTGRPLVFLAGLGDTAHEFDKLALDFTATNHVYAISRRGYGTSSKPNPANGNYSADRLGDDVLAVIDALKLDKPVLAGHSLAGEELSSIGSRHPEKVAGLIYLDAGYAYAYYAPGNLVPLGDNLLIASKDLEKKIAQLNTFPRRIQDLQPIITELLETDLPQFEKDLSATQTALQKLPQPPPNAPAPIETPQARIGEAIINGTQKYTDIKVPILAIFAVPPQLPANMPQADRDERTAESVEQANAFESGVPTAKVIRLPNAAHGLWITNESDVVQDMNNFMAGLH